MHTKMRAHSILSRQNAPINLRWANTLWLARTQQNPGLNHLGWTMFEDDIEDDELAHDDADELELEDDDLTLDEVDDAADLDDVAVDTDEDSEASVTPVRSKPKAAASDEGLPSVEAKQKERDALAKAMEEFLSRGGHIQEVAPTLDD